MPSLSTSNNNNTPSSSSSSSSSFVSSSRRRCLRTSTPSSSSGSNNNISSTYRWPLVVSPIHKSLKSPSRSHDFVSRSSSSSRFKKTLLPPPKPPVTTRTTSPRSVVVSVGSVHSSPSAGFSPTTTTSRNNSTGHNKRLVYQPNSSSNGGGSGGGGATMRHAAALLHAAQSHASLELTTLAEDASATLMSFGSTASGDSFILPLDCSLMDDHGFFLPQQRQLESESLLHLDESFEDPYLLQKEQVRLRNKHSNNKRLDERDYFCNGSSKSTSSNNNLHLQQRSSTIDTECSTTAAADSVKTANTCSSSVVLAVRYLHDEKAGLAGDAKSTNKNKNSTSIIPPLSRLHGLPPRKYFGETDQLSVPSQNEDHGGDVDDNFHHDYVDVEQENDEVEILRRVVTEEEKDNNNNDNNNFVASLASIEVDDQQGILMSNSVSCHAATLQKTRAAQQAHALYYWNARLTARIKTHGQWHFCTAEAWLELGNAHLEANEYHAAFRAFSCAQRIIQTRYAHQRPVALARALDRMGVACSKTARHVDDGGPDSSFSTTTRNNNFQTPEQTFQKAMELLLEALRIRYSELGPWHVDTVDCLNHLAWVQYDAGLYDTARRSFWEVFFVRKAIFGSSHPGVAVAAHDLANCFFKLGQLDNADNFYSIALEIFDTMNVPIQNPAVARLMRDMKRLERLQKTF